MKHLKIISICLLALVAIVFAGCSTTRKAVQSSAEQQFTSSKQENRNAEQQTSEAISSQQTISEVTSAVIEFTKIEFNDDTTAHVNKVQNRNREDTEPPNSSVKSITTGRMTLSNDRKESNEADIKRESDTKLDESISEYVEEDYAAEDVTEEKPQRGFFYYFGTIAMAVISVTSLILVINGIKDIFKFKKSQ